MSDMQKWPTILEEPETPKLNAEAHKAGSVRMLKPRPGDIVQRCDGTWDLTFRFEIQPTPPISPRT